MTLLAELVQTSRRVAATRSRLAKVRELADCLARLNPDEIGTATSWLSGALPQGRSGLAWRSVQAACGEPAREPTLQVAEVQRSLDDIIVLRGSGSNARRSAALRALFARATGDEQDFLARLIAGELRQGALEGVMLDAIAMASGVDAAAIRRAAMFAPGPGPLAAAALQQGAEGLAAFGLTLFSPAAPMLAQTAADPGQAMRDLGGAVQFEWKMDGARIQVHRLGDAVRIFTRALNDVTPVLPEIVGAVRTLHADAFVLDGEALAFDDAGRPRPFQTTMRRFGRKLDIDALLGTLPLRAYFFDCLMLDGEALVDRPLQQRLEALKRAVPADMVMPSLRTADAAAAAAFLESALAAGHEGVMAKSPFSSYEAGNRGASWLKIKPAHTLDLIVLAAEWGHGRRQGKLSNLHLGALDPATGGYVMLGKTFKGLTDAMLEWQTRELLARETRREGITVHVRPELVVEIAFSDLQASPRYPGGMALRLARVKRYRDDKRAEEADTLDTVRRMFRAQGGETPQATIVVR